MQKKEPLNENWRTVFPSFPTVLVSVESGGEKNVLTLGMVHIFSFDPPIIGIGVSPKRHSHAMIKMAKEFMINLPTKDQYKETMICGSKSGSKVDKFKLCKFTLEKGKIISSPLIKECPVNIECKVINEVVIGDHTWFMGEVQKIHIAKNYRREDALEYWAGEFRIMGNLVGKRG